MCCGCWEEAGSPTIINERVIKAVDTVKALYEVHGAGGGMHIVTDDWNCEDDNVKWCREYIMYGELEKYFKRPPDKVEIDCLEAFEALTEDERYSALGLERGYFAAHSSSSKEK